MAPNAHDSWQMEMCGGVILTAPDGDESYFAGRLVWTLTEAHTVRFLLFLSGQDVPIVRAFSPKEPGSVAATAVEAFQLFTGLVT